MKLNISKNIILNYTIVFLCSLFIGIFLSLYIENIRFTKYVEPGIVEISPTDAYKEMLEKGKDGYIFLDVRSLGEYNDLHASTSVSVPIANLYDLWRGGLPRSGKDIYIICTSGRLASVAYGYLQLHGYTNLKHIQGGISEWVAEGQPVLSKNVFIK